MSSRHVFKVGNLWHDDLCAQCGMHRGHSSHHIEANEPGSRTVDGPPDAGRAPPPPSSPMAAVIALLTRQREWSRETFGPGPRTRGVLEHIRKELAEIEADPTDIKEWVDVIILAFDGAWRAGWEPEDIVAAWQEKLRTNEQRKWPDWRQASEDVAIEHVRDEMIAVTEAHRIDEEAAP